MVSRREKSLIDPNTTYSIRKHFPISVSNLSNLVDQSIFLGISDSHFFVESFMAIVRKLACYGKVQWIILSGDLEKIANAKTEVDNQQKMKLFAFKKTVKLAVFAYSFWQKSVKSTEIGARTFCHFTLKRCLS